MQTLAVLVALALTALSAPAWAQETRQTHEVWFDAQLEPHLDNRLDRLLEGDSLTVHVDPTRVFGTSEPLAPPALAFDPSHAPPQLTAFHVIGPVAGVNAPVMLQPGTCPTLVDHEKRETEVQDKRNELDVARAGRDDKKKADPHADTSADDAAMVQVEKAISALETQAKAALEKFREEGDEVPAAEGALTCLNSVEKWPGLSSDARPYTCPLPAGDTLGKLPSTKRDWSLVKRQIDGKLRCLGSWHLENGHPISSVSANLVVGLNPPREVTVKQADGGWSSTFALERRTKKVQVIVSYEGESNTETRTLDLEVSARDTHSLVRIQAELLATNRARVVSLAIAMTPVRRAFFTRGPSIDCILLCAVSPSLLVRLSGDESALVQLGGGIGLNLSRAFQLNGGLLVGSPDAGTAWRFERSWFVGFAVDPIILSEAWSTGAPGESDNEDD